MPPDRLPVYVAPCFTHVVLTQGMKPVGDTQGANRKQRFLLSVELFCNVSPAFGISTGIRMERVC